MAPLLTRLRTIGCQSRRLVGRCLLALILLGASAVDARAFDPLGVNAAAREVRDAVGLMEATAAQLPPPAQQDLAAELQLLGRSIDWTLNRVEDQPVPLVERAVLHDLNFVADIVASVSEELQQIEGVPVDPALRARLDELSAAASARLERINGMTDRWMERTRTAVVELDAEAGAIVVRRINRVVHDGVRYTSIALLLVGLLAIGLRLLHLSEAHIRVSGLLKQSPALSSLAIGLLGVFVLGCLLLGLRPGALADLSAEVEVHAQEHPCQRLDAQQGQLAAAQELRLASLIDATKARMQEAARDCLGLPAQAAAEAVEQLATRLVPVDQLEPSATPPAGEAVAAVEPEPDDAPPSSGAPTLRASDEVLAPLFSAAAQEPAAGPEADAAAGTTAAPAPDPIISEAPPLSAAPRLPESGAAEAEPVAAAPIDEPPVPPVGPAPVTRAPPIPPIILSDLLTAEPEFAEYITTNGVNYRSAPTVDAPRLGALPAGTRVRVLSEAQGWAEVELSDGRQAFIARDYLQPAPAPN